jgi:hypothetical protein
MSKDVELKKYWYLILDDSTGNRIINYSLNPHTLISLFRKELESKIYNPADTWLYENNPIKIMLASLPIETLCLNPAQITMDIIDYYKNDCAELYCLAEIKNKMISLYHHRLPTDVIQTGDIDIEICMLDLMQSKLDEIYKIYNEPDEYIYKYYEIYNIKQSWAMWLHTLTSLDCLFYPPIEEMRAAVINAAFQVVFIKYCHCYNSVISYFDDNNRS